jgi:hypothetical protein
MNSLEFFKDLYHKENDRRHEILASLNIPFALITALSSGSYFLITSFDYSIEIFLAGVFIVSVSLAILSLLVAIYFLIRAFSDFTKGYEYSGLPYAQELYDWHKDLEEYFITHKNDKSFATKYFESYLKENLVKHTSHNMYVNDKKHGYIYRSKKFLIISFVLLLVTLIPYGYNYFNKAKNVYSIEVISEINERNSSILDVLEN